MEQWNKNSEWSPLVDVYCFAEPTLNRNRPKEIYGSLPMADDPPEVAAMEKNNSRLDTPDRGGCHGTLSNSAQIDELDGRVITQSARSHTNLSESSSAFDASDWSDGCSEYSFASDTENEDINANFAEMTTTATFRREQGDYNTDYDYDDDFEDDETIGSVMSRDNMTTVSRRARSRNHLDFANNADNADAEQSLNEDPSVQKDDEKTEEMDEPPQEMEQAPETPAPVPEPPDITKKLKINQCRLQGRRVLVRADVDVPIVDGAVANPQRLERLAPTIKFALDQGAKAVIVMGELGQPGGRVVPELSLQPVAAALEKILERPVTFLEDCVGADVEKACADPPGGSVIVLENLRFHGQEEGKIKAEDGTETEVAEAEMADFQESLCKLGDVYVNDAFAFSHKAFSSVIGIDIHQRAAGLQMEKDIANFKKIVDTPGRPYLLILGGDKVSERMPYIEQLLDTVNFIIIAGGMALTFLKVLNNFAIGQFPYDEEGEEMVAALVEKAKAKNVRISFPVDFIVADRLEEDAKFDVATLESGIPEDMMAVDIGENSRQLFSDVIGYSKTIVWIGPVGHFEWDSCAEGSKAMVDAVAQATSRGAVTMFCGGDMAECARKFEAESKVTHICTGDAASLEMLTQKFLIGIVDLSQSNSKKLSLDKLGLDQAALGGLRVLLRADLNVPVEEGVVTGTEKIEAIVPTINRILSKGAKYVTILSHRGNPAGQPDPELSMEPVARALENQLGRPVTFVPDFLSEEARDMFSNANPGSVFLLENLKFYMEEEGIGAIQNEDGEEVAIGDEEIETFRAALSSLGDAFVNDDLSTLAKKYSSVIGMTGHPRAAGPVLDGELQFYREALIAPGRPILAIMGGQATWETFEYIDRMLEYVDQIIIGGALAFPFLKAQGVNVGESPVGEDFVGLVPALMAKATENHVIVHLPVDFITAANATDNLGEEQELTMATVVDGIPEDMVGVDIGDESRAKFADVISKAHTIIWHGPMGVYETEAYSAGTVSTMDAVTEASPRGAIVIGIGGGVAAVSKVLEKTQKIQHFSPTTCLNFFGETPLPALEVLDENPGMPPQSFWTGRRRRRHKKRKKKKPKSPPKREGPLPGEPGWKYIPPYTKPLPPVITWERPKPPVKYMGAPPPGQSKPLKIEFKLPPWTPPTPPPPPPKKPLVPRLADLKLPRPAVPPPPCATDIAYSQKHKIGQAGRPGPEYAVHHLPPIPLLPLPSPRARRPRPPVQLQTVATFDKAGSLVIHINGDDRNVPEGAQVKTSESTEVFREFRIQPVSRVYFFPHVRRKKQKKMEKPIPEGSHAESTTKGS